MCINRLFLLTMLDKYKYYVWLQITVLIFGFTGILGKLIEANSYLLVWYRVGIALIGIGLYLILKKHSLQISKKTFYKIIGIGFIIAVHWITFFEAIKQSNVSVALVCLSSSTLFTSIIEPFYFKRKIKSYELIFGLLIIVGLYFVFSFEYKYFVGMLFSFLSASLASWFTVLNGILIKEFNAKTIAFYELLGAFTLVSIYLVVKNGFELNAFKISVQDIKWLLILGTVCTAFAFILSVEVMRKITPYSVTMSVNLEPIYTIILAFIIWPETETMSYGFYLGTIIVIATIFFNGYIKNNESKSISLKS